MRHSSYRRDRFYVVVNKRGQGGGGLTDHVRGGLFADPKVTILRKYVRLFCARVNAVRRW